MRRTIYLLIAFCLLTLSVHSYTENWSPDLTIDFANQLFQWGDYEEASLEYYRYLHSGKAYFDHAVYMRSLSQYRAGHHSAATSSIERWYKEIDDEIIQEDIGFLYAHIAISQRDLQRYYYLRKNYSFPWKDRRWAMLEMAGLGITGEYEQISDVSAQFSLDPEALKLGALAADYSPKSPALAAFLSALIPGAGKFYSNQWADGIFSMASVGSAAGFAAYTFHKQGIESPRAWIYSATAAVLYASNVYGSYQSAQRTNRKQQQEIEYAAEAVLFRIRP